MSERLSGEGWQDIQEQASGFSSDSSWRLAVQELKERRAADLELDDYEAVNLIWLTDLARSYGLDTGDWLQQIRGKLKARGTGNIREPNCATAKMTQELMSRALARSLSAEEREALKFARQVLDADDDMEKYVDALRRSAIKAIDKLLGAKP